MTVNIQELVEIVENLNAEIQEVTDDALAWLTILTDGVDQGIEFLGMSIWNSEDDLREITTDGDYEPLGDYLKRAITKQVINISRIKIMG